MVECQGHGVCVSPIAVSPRGAHVGLQEGGSQSLGSEYLVMLPDEHAQHWPSEREVEGAQGF